MKTLIRGEGEMKAMKAQVRPLRQIDIDDVLEISKQVWNGHDYIPGVVRDWLKDEDSFTICVEVENKVVGISNLRVIENGKTGWMEGLRVHPDFRGEGYANLLTDGLVEHAISIGIPRLRYTTVVENKASMALAERAGLEELFRMIVFWADVPEKINEVKNVNVQRISTDTLLESLEDYPEIMPGPIIIYDWKARDLTPEGIREVAKHRTFWTSEDENGLALSFGGRRYEERDDAWSCTVYSDNVQMARAHLVHHVRIAMSSGLDVIVSILNKEFKNLVAELPWLEETERFREVALMERRL
ncbi:MAG: GNAT family N-acetyltransferase [Promethearchaeia archaeon]